eukprot:Sdes_comp19869_c0_seq3m12146
MLNSIVFLDTFQNSSETQDVSESESEEVISDHWKPKLYKKQNTVENPQNLISAWQIMDDMIPDKRKNRYRNIVGHTNRRRFDEHPAFYHNHMIPKNSLFYKTTGNSIVTNVFASNCLHQPNFNLLDLKSNSKFSRASSAPPIVAYSKVQKLLQSKVDLKGKSIQSSRAGLEASQRLYKEPTKSFTLYKSLTGKEISKQNSLQSKSSLFRKDEFPTPFLKNGDCFPPFFRVKIYPTHNSSKIVESLRYENTSCADSQGDSK